MSRRSRRASVGRQSLDKVAPLFALFHEINEELLKEDKEQLLRLVKDKIPLHEYRRLRDSNIDDWLACLHDCLGDEELTLKCLWNTFYFGSNDRVMTQGENIEKRVIDVIEDYCNDLKSFQETTAMKRNMKFVGREDTILEIQEKLNAPDTKGICICGSGGIGKTSLATEICWRMKGWKSFKVDMRNVESFERMVDKILTKLNLATRDSSGASLNLLVSHINGDTDNRSVIFVDQLDEAMQQGNEDYFLGKLEYLMERITNNKVKFLFTCRSKLTSLRSVQDLHELEVQELDVQNSKKVLQSNAKDQSVLATNQQVITDAQYESLAKLCYGNPLALALIGDQLRSQKPGDVISFLKKDGNLTTLMEKVIGASIKLLNNVHQLVMMKLSIFHVAFNLSAASNILEVDTADAKFTLHYLESRQLVVVEDTSTAIDEYSVDFTKRDNILYSLHPLIHGFLRAEGKGNKKYAKLLKTTRETFVTYYDRVIGDLSSLTETDCMLATFKTIEQLPHILEALSSQSLDPPDLSSAVKYLKHLQRFRYMRLVFQCHSERMNYFTQMAKQAEEKGDRVWYLLCQLWIADHYSLEDGSRGKHESISILERNKDEIVRLKQGHPNVCHSMLFALYCFVRARIYAENSDFKKALHKAKKAKNILKKFSRQDLMLARSYNLVGHIYHRQQEADLALKYHIKAYELSSEIVKTGLHFDQVEYTMNVGTCYHVMGQKLHDDKGLKAAKVKYRKALEWYDRCIQMHKDMKMREDDRMFRVLVNTTNVCFDLKDFRKALEYGQDAKGLAMRFLHHRKTDQVKSIITVGHAYRKIAWRCRKMEEQDSARDNFEKAEKEFHDAVRLIENETLKATAIGRPFGDLHIGYPDVLQRLGKDHKIEKVKRHLLAIDCGVSLQHGARWKEIDEEPDDDSSSSESSCGSHPSSESFDEEINNNINDTRKRKRKEDSSDTGFGKHHSKRRKRKSVPEEDESSDDSDGELGMEGDGGSWSQNMRNRCTIL